MTPANGEDDVGTDQHNGGQQPERPIRHTITGMADPVYNARAYKAAKVAMAGAPCWRCGKPSDSVDHVPPVSSMPKGRWVGIFRPACMSCQIAEGHQIMHDRRHGIRPALPSRAW